MILKIVILTIIIEILTILGRLCFGSVKEFNKRYKIKFRIHHGYIGIVLIIIHLIFQQKILLILGLPLLFADAIHHFIILPLWIKKTEFP